VYSANAFSYASFAHSLVHQFDALTQVSSLFALLRVALRHHHSQAQKVLPSTASALTAAPGSAPTETKVSQGNE